jgi:hypothetical protein
MTLATLQAAGVGRKVTSLYVDVAKITAADLVTNYVFGFKGRILAVDFVVMSAVTTGSKAATLTTKLVSGSTTTALTGGVLALTSANCTPAGTVVSGTAITALNSFAAGDGLTISASSVTAFVEGAGYLMLKLINDDTANAIAAALGGLRNP